LIKTVAIRSIESLGEGIAIVFTTFVLILITAAADYVKDKKFIELQSIIKDEDIPVIRGKQSASQSVSIWSLVVGDVILLEQGSRVPTDCLLLESADLYVCTQIEETVGQQSTKEFKSVLQGGDPILLAGSKIVRGTGKALVCCVGENNSVTKESIESMDLNSDTAMQKKLSNLES
jgi:Ca2+-transporting ATPase